MWQHNGLSILGRAGERKGTSCVHSWEFVDRCHKSPAGKKASEQPGPSSVWRDFFRSPVVPDRLTDETGSDNSRQSNCGCGHKSARNELVTRYTHPANQLPADSRRRRGIPRGSVLSCNICNKKGCDSWPYIGLLHNWELYSIWKLERIASSPKLNVDEVLNTQMGSPELMSS